MKKRMGKKILGVAIIVAAAIATISLMSAANESSIQVTSPNGGEYWRAVQKIEWTSSSVEKVDIYYSYNNGEIWVVVVTDWNASTGYIYWDTTTVTESNQVLINITGYADGRIWDTSDSTFTVDNTNPYSFVNHISPYWRSSTFDITASASDAMSGVASVELFYRYSNDNSTWSDWTSFKKDSEAPWEWSFDSPDGDGYYEFYSIATDNAGNDENPPAMADAIAGIDTQSPTTNHSLSGTMGENDWYVSDVEVTLDVSDDTSGVNETKYRIDDGSWNTYAIPFTVTTDGEHTIEYYSIGNAGNEESKKSVNFKIDKTAPTTSHSLDPSEPNGENGWYTSNVTVTLTSTDATSGVDYTEYRIDSGSWEKYTNAFTVSEDGNHTIDYYSVDNAGNDESVNSVSFKIDKTEPIINITNPKKGCLYIFDREVIRQLGKNTIIFGKITIRANATDNTSGIDRVEFLIDNESKHNDTEFPYNWSCDERSFFFKHSIKVIAYDKAGNMASNEIEVRIFNILKSPSPTLQL